MIHYRPFLNSDPPALAEIWRSQPPSNALIQPMTPAVLDEMVFSKPYFDPHGVILAIEDDKPIGFVHAGFGPNGRLTAIDTARGTTALLLVAPHPDRESIAQELLSRSERYLRERGATELFGGATRMLAPFYFGLYGGSQLSGVLASDSASAELFRGAGYNETTYARIFRQDLTRFRQPVDRELMQARRQFQVVKQTESLPRSWWEACEFASIERMEFVLLPKSKGPPAGEAKLWDVEPLASSWGVHAVGLVSMEVFDSSSAAAIHFVGDILRQLQGFGISLAEFQLRTDETLALEVCERLGFREIDRGLLFQKPAAL